jgi:fucose permease
MTHMFIRIPAPKIGGQNLSNGTASERIRKDADYNRLSMRYGSAASARRAASALFVGNGFAFGVWSAHISVFKQNYQLSNAQLTIPLFTLALGAILSMPVIGRVFHRLDSSDIIWKGLICYAVMLSLVPWTKSLTWLAMGTFCLGLVRGTVDVSANTLAVITERTYGSAIMSSLQGFWSLGGVIGAAFSSVLLRQHASAKQDLGAAAACMIVTVLVARPYLAAEEGPVDPPAGWALIPRALWALAAVAFLSLFIEGAIGDWGTVYLRSSLHVSAATAATGYAVFSVSMMTGCFVGDYLKTKLGATNLLRASGALVACGFGFALLGTTYERAMIGFLIAGFGTSNMVALIFGAAARRRPGGVGAAIAAASSVGYLGFLVGPPVVGSVSGMLGLRMALALVVVAGVIISISAREVMAEAGS